MGKKTKDTTKQITKNLTTLTDNQEILERLDRSDLRIGTYTPGKDTPDPSILTKGKMAAKTFFNDKTGELLFVSDSSSSDEGKQLQKEPQRLIPKQPGKFKRNKFVKKSRTPIKNIHATILKEIHDHLKCLTERLHTTGGSPEQYDRAQTSENNLQEQINTFNQKLGNLTNQQEKFVDDIIQIQDKNLAMITEQHTQLEDNYAKRAIENKKLKDKIQSLQEKTEEFELKNLRKDRERDELKKTISTLEERIMEANQRIRQQEQLNQELVEKNLTCKQDIKLKLKLIDNQDQEIKDLKETNKEIMINLHQAQENEYTNRLTENKKLANLEAENDYLRKNIEEKEREVDKLKQEQSSVSQTKMNQPNETLPKSTLIITPQQETTSIQDLRQTIINLPKPDQIQITKFKNKTNLLEIRCNNEIQKEKLKTYLKANLEDMAAIKDKTPKMIKLICPNIPQDINTETIVEAIKENYNITEEEIGDITRLQSYSNKEKENLTIFLPASLAKQIIFNKYIFVGLKQLRCFKFISMYRCHNCHIFNSHSTKDCPNKTLCAYCAGKHDSETCTNQTPECINCILSNKEYKEFGYPQPVKDTSHPAYSPQCPSYLRERLIKATTA